MTAAGGGFHHEAYFYEGQEAFVTAAAPFVEDGLGAAEPVLVAVDRAKIELLASHLGRDRAGLTFVDMADVGRNPACILHVWHDFVASSAGSACRGIGEPLWPERTTMERAECHRHEQLLNLAFRDRGGFRLMCPYETTGLGPRDAVDVRRSHPVLGWADRRHGSPEYSALADLTVFDEPLEELAGDPYELSIEVPSELAALRARVSTHSRRAGLSETRARDAVTAVNEIASNSLHHGGGRAEIRLWEGDAGLVCEVRDQGHVANPLAGRLRPGHEQEGGRGLWLVNHLCDLVELRTSPSGTIVRVHLSSA